jgi:histone H3/H4
MISEAAFDKACKAAGAKQVSDAALTDFEAWMTTLMNDAATKAVGRMQAAKRIRVEKQDIGE